MSSRWFSLLLLLALVIGAACTEQAPIEPTEEDEALWLEESAGERALAWVADENAKTLSVLEADPRFARYEEEGAAILTDPNRIPFASLMGDQVYNYWQDREHPYGLWRRSPVDAYVSGEPEWETLIDLDALSESEGKPWFLAGTSCRLPESSRCLVSLSRRSMDAAEVREFDVERREFIEDGFRLPEFKSGIWWEDDDTVLVATDWGPDSLTAAEYPRSFRRWRRGTPLADAELVFEVDPERPRTYPMLIGAAGAGSLVAVSPVNFFINEYWLIRPDGTRSRLPLPSRMIVYGGFGDDLLIRLNEDWTPGDEMLPSGALAAFARQALVQDAAIENARVIYAPEPDEAVRQVVASGEALYVALLKGYRSRVLRLTPTDGGFSVEPLDLDGAAFAVLRGRGPTPGSVFLSTESPLEPPRLWLVGPEPDARKLIAEEPAQFDATGLETTILETASRDGTPIHYTVIARKGIELDGSHPTLIYGYGGYDVALTPRYEPLFGKLWLERGGVYVHAYLRGGGERGPEWHQGAMLKNRQQPYDDMNAVIDDLHQRGYSSPAGTGIMGRSNGGLMVAAVMEQIPEKLGAVVVGGPLIDMLRFTLLPPGASWTAEYGRPDDPEMRDFLASYSPYHQLRPDVDYPTPLIITSTWDDRVLPGHARRFAAKLEALGHDAYYFEDEQGGHYWELAGGPHPGDWRLRARARAVEFTYLAKQLGNDSAAAP